MAKASDTPETNTPEAPAAPAAEVSNSSVAIADKPGTVEHKSQMGPTFTVTTF